MALSKRTLLIGCGSCLALAAIPVLIIIIFILYDTFQPAAWKEKSFAEDFVKSDIISPKPPTMVWFKTLYYQEATLSGEGNSCIAAYTLDPGAFDQILHAHKWVTPYEHFAENDFRRAWPGYKGDIESYYYNGDPGPNSSGYSTLMAVSADHTKMVFDTRDAWERPFEKQ